MAAIGDGEKRELTVSKGIIWKCVTAFQSHLIAQCRFTLSVLGSFEDIKNLPAWLWWHTP